MPDVSFACGQAMIANTEEQRIMNETSGVVKKYQMKANIKRTTVMKIGISSIYVRITVDGAVLQQVEEFNYWEVYFLQMDIQRRISAHEWEWQKQVSKRCQLI